MYLPVSLPESCSTNSSRPSNDTRQTGITRKKTKKRHFSAERIIFVLTQLKITSWQEHYVINLGRQLGSGGKEIGENLAKDLGIAFYDKELINLASEESGLCKEFFEKADEKASQSILGGLFGSRFPFIQKELIVQLYLSNDSLFKIQSDVIRHLAKKSRACLWKMCRLYPARPSRCANVFVSASPEARIERLMKLHNISAEEAEELMEKADKKRSSYYNYYSYKTWGAAATYHLCIDSSVLGIDGTGEFIKNYKIKLPYWTKYYTAFSKHGTGIIFNRYIQKP